MKGFELKKKLQQTGISQKDFAKLCGVRPETVNRWCNGWISIPKYAEALFIMEYKGVDIERKLRILVDEGRFHGGITPKDCPSYDKVWELIQEVKAIGSSIED